MSAPVGVPLSLKEGGLKEGESDLICLAAFPKSGITYLGFLVFHALHGPDADVSELDRRHIIDIHENLALVPPLDGQVHFIKSHHPYGPAMPLVQRLRRVVYLLRDPIDVMMSAWDYLHLTGGARLKAFVDGDPQIGFRRFVGYWLTTGSGEIFRNAGTWTGHVSGWNDQRAIPLHRVRYDRLVDDPRAELAAVLNFIGIKIPAERIDEAVGASSMETMRAVEEREIRERRPGAFYRDRLAPGYAEGRRFIGAGHRGSYEAMLEASEKILADRTFGPLIQRYLPAHDR